MDIKKFLRGFGRGIFILLLFGGTMVYQSAFDTMVSLKPAVSFQDMLDGAEVKIGTHVAGDVVYNLDYFASESTYTKRKDGSRSGSRKSGNYYLIPTKEGYIGLKCRQDDVAALNKLADETFDFLVNGVEPSTKVFMEGSVVALDKNVVKYYEEYLEDMGYSESEITAMGEPLVIQYTVFSAVRIMFLIGAALIALALFILWRRYTRE